METNYGHQRRSTRFSPDGQTVFVRLRLDLLKYEFARFWAAFHAEADPEGTAEDQLEGYLNAVLGAHMAEMGCRELKQDEADHKYSEYYENSDHDLDDGIPL